MPEAIDGRACFALDKGIGGRADRMSPSGIAAPPVAECGTFKKTIDLGIRDARGPIRPVPLPVLRLVARRLDGVGRVMRISRDTNVKPLLGRMRTGRFRLTASMAALGAFARATAGNVAVEYALCVGGVGAVGVSGFAVIGTELAALLAQIGQQVCLATHLVCVG